jgi:xanthine/CO dehydrogenase XdhC/CoxF family maturation factor
MREIGDIVREFERRRGEPLAIATLVKTRGSSYRRCGARMLIARDGSCTGSLSGGCLEEEVALRAREVIDSGKPAWMEFDTRRRFGCHGALEIFVERANPEFLSELAAHLHARQSATIAIIYSRTAAAPGSRIQPDGESAVAGTLLQVVDPPLRLLIVGEGPDNTALGAFAHALGWTVTAVHSATELDPPYDAWTAAIIKTHNYGRDFAALRALLPCGLRYVGLLGPRRRRDQLLGDLLDTGVQPYPCLFGPAGLDLGCDAPESIALAIVAEIQAVFANASVQSLRERKSPIHTPAAILASTD